MRQRIVVTILVAAALAATASVSAGSPPVLCFDVGKTGAISGPYTDGGLSLGLGAMWRVEETPWALPVRFGVMGFMDDMGSEVGPITTADGTPLGSATLGHQAVYGGAFRLDWEPALSPSWRPYATGTWGYYRVADDVRGEAMGAVSSTGFSLGAGVGRLFTNGHSAGLVVRYHRLFNDVTGRYVSGAVEWGWRNVR